MAVEARSARFVSRTIFLTSGKWFRPQSATNATLPVVLNTKKMNRILLILILSVWTMSGYSQKYMQEGKKKYLIDWKIEILGDSSECFNPEIPFNIRLNTKDTVTFIADKDYKFYTGKCDTIHVQDTIEMYFDCLNLYDLENNQELFWISYLSKALKKMQESNLTTLQNDSIESYRIVFFDFQNPVVIKLTTDDNERIVSKRVFNGSFINPLDEISNSTTVISSHKWKELTTLIRQISSYKPDSYFGVLYPDLIVESYVNGKHNYLYIEHHDIVQQRMMNRKMKIVRKLID